MASPLKSIGEFLFGGGGSPSPMLMQPQAPAAPPPIQSPTGTQSTNKPQQGTSFLAAAAPVPQQTQTAGKSLLGQ